MLPFLFWILSFAYSERINTTDTITINQGKELELDIGADGVVLNFKAGPFLTLKGVQSDKSKLISVILEFDDDDYTNKPFNLQTENVRVTFACDDPIVFSLSGLNSKNSDFSSTKPIHAELTSQTDVELDYVSFVNGFGPGGPLAGTGSTDGTGLYSVYNAKLEVSLPDNVKEVTFSDASFYIELDTSEKDSFTFVLSKNFDIVLISQKDRDEIIILDAKASQINGNITIIAENVILNATDDFLQVTSSKAPISICCEIIILPYETIPSGLFKFITADYQETTDQVIMTKGIRAYCLYDTTKCDVHGYIPMKVESQQFTVPSGKSMSYVLSSSTGITFLITKTSASSLTINGTDTQKDAGIIVQDSSSLNDNFTLDNVNLRIDGASFTLKNLFIGQNVKITEQATVKFSVSESFNSSFDWYLANIHQPGHQIELELQPIAKICLFDFNNIVAFKTTASELSIQYDDDAQHVVTFTTASNNRVIIYTNDKEFEIDSSGATESVFGNFELHVLLQIGQFVEITFTNDWADVKTVFGGPIGIYVHTNGYSKSHKIIMPFSEFPAGFIEYDKSLFTVYSTINTTLCLYNSGKSPCTPIPGGHAVEIPSSGKINIEKGTQYIYSADESVTIPPNLLFEITQTSARSIGFNFIGQILVQLPDAQLDSLDITNVNITIAISNSDVLTVQNYRNNDADLYIDNQDFSTSDGRITVTNSMEISPRELQEFFSGWNQFTGTSLNLNDNQNLLNSIRFTPKCWDLSITGLTTTTSIPHAGLTFVIESGSENVTFDVPDGATAIQPLRFISTKANSIVYFADSWAEFDTTSPTPIEIDCEDSICQQVSFYHPFAYMDDRVAKMVTVHPHIIDCPYQNTSVCLSTSSTDTCGLEGYYIKQVMASAETYTVPPGFRFSIWLASDSLKITYNGKSAKNFTVQAYLSSGLTQRPATLSLSSSTPIDSMVVLNDLILTLDCSSALTWTLAYLDLFDVTFTSSQLVTLNVNDFSAEMDIFYHMTQPDATFADGRIVVQGSTTLRDSNEEYLNEIKVGSDKWTLSVITGGTTLNIPIERLQFPNLIFGVNRPPTEDPRFIPITLEAGATTIAGGVDINIEEEDVYLTIGSEWKNIAGVTGDRIQVRATHGKGFSRFVYNSDCDVAISRAFDIETDTVHLLNNQTAPICLLPDSSYVKQCFQNSMDMLPVITADLEYLLDEERTYVIYGTVEQKHNFRYKADPKPYSVSIIAANSITVLMDNAPSTVNFHFDSLIDEDGVCNLVFTKSMTLQSLRFDDSVRIQANVDNFKLTILDDLILDYKSFKRFFNSPGIFSNKNTLELTNGEISIHDDTGRYNTITLHSNSWTLDGNQDAWNTTLEQRGSSKQQLRLITSNSNIVIRAMDSEVVPISLNLTTHFTLVHLDETMCDIESYTGGKTSTFTSQQACTIYSSFKTLPADKFILYGSFTQTYVAPTVEYSICLYPEGQPACKVPGTQPVSYIDDQNGFRIKCAKSLKIYLTTDTKMNYQSTSTRNLAISGDSDVSPSLVIEDSEASTLSELSLEVTNVLLGITQHNGSPGFASLKLTNCQLEVSQDVTVSKFETDVASLQLVTNTINVKSQLNLKATSAALSVNSRGPKIVLADASTVTLGDLGHIFTRFDFGYDITSQKNKFVVSTLNDQTKSFVLTLLNLPTSLTSKFTFADSKSIYMTWLGQTFSNAQSLPAFSFVFGKSSSVTITRTSSAGSDWPSDYSLSLSSPTAPLVINAMSTVSLNIPNSYINVNYKTLSNIRDLSSFSSSHIEVASDVQISQIHLGNKVIQIEDYQIQRETGKTLTILHENKGHNLTIGRYSEATSITDATVMMKSGTTALVRNGFVNVKSGTLAFKKSDTGTEPTTVVIHDSSRPSAISSDPSINVIIDEKDDDDSSGGGGSSGLSAGAIVGIVFVVIAVIAGGVVGFILYRKKYPKVDVTDYDYAPPLLDDSKDLDSLSGEKAALKL